MSTNSEGDGMMTRSRGPTASRSWLRPGRVVAALAVAAGLLSAAVYLPAEAAVTRAAASDAGRPPTGQPGRLSVSGRQILDPARHPIILRGYNWGEWGTVQPQDAAENLAQGANSVRIP